MRNKILAASTLAALLLAGSAWAGCPGYGPGAGMGPGGWDRAATALTGPDRKEGNNRIQAQRRKSRELRRAHREEVRALKKKIAASRKALRKTLRSGPWDEATIRPRAEALGDAIAEMITRSARLRGEMRGVWKVPASADGTPVLSGAQSE